MNETRFNIPPEPGFATLQECVMWHYLNRRYFCQETRREKIVPILQQNDVGLQPGQVASDFMSNPWSVVLFEFHAANCNERYYDATCDWPVALPPSLGENVEGGFRIAGAAALKGFVELMFSWGRGPWVILERYGGSDAQLTRQAVGASEMIKRMSRMTPTERARTWAELEGQP